MKPQPYHLLRAAAALAYHVPGVGVRLEYPGCPQPTVVAPALHLGAVMHPTELRDLLSANNIFDALGGLATQIGAPVDVEPAVSLVPLLDEVTDLGMGLIALGHSPRTYVFVTFVEPDAVVPTIAATQTIPDEVSLRELPAPPPDDDAEDVMRIRSIYDPELAATVVVIEPYPSTPFGLEHRLESIARAIASSCAVAELAFPDPELL